MFGVDAFANLCGPAKVQFVLFVIVLFLVCWSALLLITITWSISVLADLMITFLPVIVSGWLVLLGVNSLCPGKTSVAWAAVSITVLLPIMQLLRSPCFGCGIRRCCGVQFSLLSNKK
jgi:hypothetical protein